MKLENNIKIIEFDTTQKGHFEAFKKLNYEWIEKYFKVETPDMVSLENPDKYFIEIGGCILLAEQEGVFLGTAALKPIGDNSMELCKMGVTADARGKKIGELIGNAIVQKAKQMNVRRLYLETNSALTPALNLYKKLGFSQIALPPSPYKRADVAMEMLLM